MNYTNQPYNADAKPTGKYAPLSPWAYFGLTLLFSIPVVGFIFLIVFSVSDANINRRNFARSYWCALLVLVAVAIIAFVVILIAGGSFSTITQYFR